MTTERIYNRKANMAFLPRAEGDGMDSEALKMSPSTAVPGQIRVGKKIRVNQNSVKHVKTKNKSPKSVPHESHQAVSTPSKQSTAITLMNDQDHPIPVAMSTPRAREQTTPTGKSLQNFTIATAQPLSILLPDNQLSFNQFQPSKENLSASELHSKEIDIPLYNTPSHPYETLKNQQLKTQKNNKMGNSSSDVSIDISDSSGLGDTSIGKLEAGVKPVVISMATSGRDTEVIPGSTAFNKEVEELVRERDSLILQLETQTKVNADLKKMLVASMGDDLHVRVESLVRDKVQLKSDLGDYSKKIYQDSENLDEISIQADLWRSKYMGTRMLIDQLQQSNDDLSMKLEQSLEVVQQLLQDSQEVKESLVNSHRSLRQLKNAFDPGHAHKPCLTSGDVIDLSRSNKVMSDKIRFRLLGNISQNSVPVDLGVQDSITTAEFNAHQLLMIKENGYDKASQVSSNKGPSSLNVSSKIDRFHPQVRYENITFNCCRKCKGDLKVM